MDWLQARMADRLDVRRVLPGAQTVMALACNYFHGDDEGPIARYARGRDYHATLKDRIRSLRRSLKAAHPTVRSFSTVDAGPMLEKVWAVKAGLGYVGKNGCLITPEFGSWVLLATYVLDAEVDVYAQALVEERCGRCRLCIDACPTDAFVKDAVVDAGKCLSYWTIENEGLIPAPIARAMDGIAFGCDVCQDVCPLNASSLVAGPRFAPRPVASVSTVGLAAMSKEQYASWVPGTPLARAGYDGLRRNAAYALGAGKRHDARTVLESLANDSSDVVRDAARWALEQLSP